MLSFDAEKFVTQEIKLFDNIHDIDFIKIVQNQTNFKTKLQKEDGNTDDMISVLNFLHNDFTINPVDNYSEIFMNVIQKFNIDDKQNITDEIINEYNSKYFMFWHLASIMTSYNPTNIYYKYPIKELFNITEIKINDYMLENDEIISNISKLNSLQSLDVSNTKITDSILHMFKSDNIVALNCVNCPNIFNFNLMCIFKNLKQLDCNFNSRIIDHILRRPIKNIKDYNDFELKRHIESIVKLNKYDELTDDDVIYLDNITFLALEKIKKFNGTCFKHLANLEVLDIDRCKNISLEGLRYNQRLIILDVKDCKKINIIDAMHIPNLKTLKCKVKVNNGNDIVKIEDLETLKKIAPTLDSETELDISNSFEENSRILNRSNLVRLNINNNKYISDKGFIHMRKLESLECNGTFVNKKALKYIASTLKHLSCIDCHHINPCTLNAVPKLESLVCDFHSNIFNMDITDYSSYIVYKQKAHSVISLIDDVITFADDTLIQISDLTKIQPWEYQDLKNIRILDCSNNMEINSNCIRKMYNLEELNCENCINIDDGGIHYLTKLTKLNCKNTNVARCSFMKLCNLQDVDVSNCEHVDIQCFIRFDIDDTIIEYYHPKLVKLICKNNFNMTSADLQKLPSTVIIQN